MVRTDSKKYLQPTVYCLIYFSSIVDLVVIMVTNSTVLFVKQSSQRQLSFPWLLSGLGSWPNIQCILPLPIVHILLLHRTSTAQENENWNEICLACHQLTVDAILIPTICFLPYLPRQWSLVKQEVHLSCGLYNRQVPQHTWNNKMFREPD